MSLYHSCVLPNTYLFLRLSSDLLRLVEIKPNTIIEISKLGSFPSNLLLGRPYYHTYEVLDRREGELYSRLGIVPPAELNAEVVAEDVSPAESRDATATASTAQATPESFDLLAEGELAVMKNNRLTVDDASRQTLSQAEIEELKKTSGGKDIIEKILANHTGLDEKTAFSRAKYMLRKQKKFLKRFTVFPMDLGYLMEYITEKEAPRLLELRLETLGLITAWSNAHFSQLEGLGDYIGGKWLTVDETGGLVTGALAERMGILYPPLLGEQSSTAETNSSRPGLRVNGEESGPTTDAMLDAERTAQSAIHRDLPIPARTNTITFIHSAVQPNVSLLKYFGFDTSNPNLPPPEAEHPLHTHLKPVSWLQVVSPEDDPTYAEPEHISEEVLSSWKSSKRGTYFKKRRRWERCRSIVDETRAGGFEGLVVASRMDPVGVLAHTVPLVQGGGHVVLYSPHIEPLVRLMDMYSKERRTAYIQHLSKGEVPDPTDFPLDPRLLLAPTLQTSRARELQVLPGRTHPLMTSRGGPEGYVFTARKVLPLEGGVEARGNFATKRRKIAQ